MKNIIKISGLLIFGLMVALLGYPLFHEGGHAIVAFLLGQKIESIELFPVPCVKCGLQGSAESEIVFIGLGGIMIPYIIAMIVNIRRFWGWYSMLIFRIISVYATALSLISVWFEIFGINWVESDISLVMEVFPECTSFLIVLFIFMTVFGIAKIVKDHPICRCLNHFVK